MLKIKYEKIGIFGVLALCKCLLKFPNLTKLMLQISNFLRAGYKHLFETLEQMGQLKEINIETYIN